MNVVCFSGRLGNDAKLITSQTQRPPSQGDLNPATANRTFLKRLATLAGVPDFKVLDAHLKSLQAEIRKIFENRLAG
jgi:hypothetical protein